MLSSPYLPSTLISVCLDVLLKGTSERDFIMIVTEIVQGLRADSEVVTSEEEGEEIVDGIDEGDEEDVDMERSTRVKSKGLSGAAGGRVERGEERERRRKELDLRCLMIVRALLERTMGVGSFNSFYRCITLPLPLSTAPLSVPLIHRRPTKESGN